MWILLLRLLIFIAMPRRRCPDCDGRGTWVDPPYGRVTCASCEGAGRAS